MPPPFAKKSLGQNFLIDPNYRQRIVGSLKIASDDRILEIGPGRGALTALLAKHAPRLWLVEKDRELAADLAASFGASETVTVCNADFLEVDLPGLFGAAAVKIRVVGNLPYNVASQILIRLLENRGFFSELFLMFQKEMALRFIAGPSTKDYGLLSLWAQIYAECKILFHLPPTAFKPAPKIQSSFVYFKIRGEPLISDNDAAEFFTLMRLLFQQRRKTVKSVLKPHARYDLSGLEGRFGASARAEALGVSELIELFRLVTVVEAC